MEDDVLRTDAPPQTGHPGQPATGPLDGQQRPRPPRQLRPVDVDDDLVGARRHPADAVGAVGVGRPVCSVLGEEGRQDARLPEFLLGVGGSGKGAAVCGDLGRGELAGLAGDGLPGFGQVGGGTALR
ncbi:hypothetical protein [Kitasatospora sp. NPDC093102]|uniref:hypothetical protein n=1 Tax=Kitasatospora sp. NPDC093102 TaxID=3155069 RepID=UPI00341884B9